MKYKNPTVIYGGLNFSYPSDMNYGKFVLDKFLEGKERVALINGASGDQVTYREMAQQIVNTASSLEDFGVSSDDVVGICSENRTEFLISAIAVMCTEAVVTLINSAYSKDELIHTLNISRPKYMFLSQSTYKSYYNIMKSLDFITKFFIFESSVSEGNVQSFRDMASKNVNIDSFRPKANFNGKDKTALILYSSGTTGLPKGAKLSHRNLITTGLQPLCCRPSLVSMSVVPWSSTAGIILTMRQLIDYPIVVYLDKFNEELYLRCIEKYKVGFLLTVPPLIVRLSKSKILQNYDVSSVQFMYCGGAPLAISVIEQVSKRFPNFKNVLQGYGMTESTGGITEEHKHSPRPGSVGQVIDGNIIKIVNIDTRKLLGPNQRGEICIKGSVLFQGYMGRDLNEEIDDEGFYPTGDIGYYDEDGYFYIVDRIKELIKYKAGQVAPSELENILRQHPAVKDTGVVGIPDPLAGELPTAFVVKTPGVLVTEKELIDFVGGKVSSWKQLRGGVRFIQEIPRNRSGKILRRKLREMQTMSKL